MHTEFGTSVILYDVHSSHDCNFELSELLLSLVIGFWRGQRTCCTRCLFQKALFWFRNRQQTRSAAKGSFCGPELRFDASFLHRLFASTLASIKQPQTSHWLQGSNGKKSTMFTEHHNLVKCQPVIRMASLTGINRKTKRLFP